ncbi:MAG TPA: ATP-binding protein [Verrucomicrobiae bacterium]|jgi:signal transduction histidine kinase|nr:ATP-binding protein [Verrucomicrobiae bacterium]
MSTDNPSKKNGGDESSAKWNPIMVSEQNLRRLDRLASLGLLSAGMAHEIKNGLTAIQTFIELLLQKGEDKELAEVVGRELKRIDSLVSQMLRFAAPGRNAFADVNVHNLLDHSLRLVEHQISGKLISLKRDYKAAPDTIRGDEFQLQQAFMNLLFNAIEAMGTNGDLTVGTEITDGRQLKIQIRDTGVGISAENLGRLFEPFFTTKKNGTGLGLAISQRIVNEHGGSISAQGESNKGSTFSILLPTI